MESHRIAIIEVLSIFETHDSHYSFLVPRQHDREAWDSSWSWWLVSRKKGWKGVRTLLFAEAGPVQRVPGGKKLGR